MPVPIKSIPDGGDNKSYIDFSMFLTPLPSSNKKKVMASNQDASLLFDIWSKGEKSTSGIKVSPELNISARDITRLKNMGFITSKNDEIEITKKGKVVITTMVLGEESKFEKNRTQKSYTEILASMDKKNKPGYRIPKFASDNNNRLDLR